MDVFKTTAVWLSPVVAITSSESNSRCRSVPAYLEWKDGPHQPCGVYPRD